jgi:hypothetical protein
MNDLRNHLRASGMYQQEPMDLDAAPDNRTLEDIYGSAWMHVTAANFTTLRKAGRDDDADRWAAAKHDTLFRSLPKVEDI